MHFAEINFREWDIFWSIFFVFMPICTFSKQFKNFIGRKFRGWQINSENISRIYRKTAKSTKIYAIKVVKKINNICGTFFHQDYRGNISLGKVTKIWSGIEQRSIKNNRSRVRLGGNKRHFYQLIQGQKNKRNLRLFVPFVTPTSPFFHRSLFPHTNMIPTPPLSQSRVNKTNSVYKTG